MAVIRFDPQLPSLQPRVSPQGTAEGAIQALIGQGIATAAQQFGQGLDTLALMLLQQQRQQDAQERAFARAAADAQATLRANDALSVVDSVFEQTKQHLLSEKAYDKLVPEFERIAREQEDFFLSRHLDDQYNNPFEFRQRFSNGIAQRLAHIRAERTKILTQASLDALSREVDQFAQRAQFEPIDSVVVQFQDLQTEVDRLVATQVIDAPGGRKILEGALVNAMTARAAFLTEQDPSTAPDRIRAEHAQLRAFLSPLQNKALIDMARQEREAGKKNLTDTAEAAFRQIQVGITAGGMSLEEALQEGARHGVDPGKIEAAYSQYHNAVFTELDRRRSEAERTHKERSREFRASAVERAAKDHTFDVLAFIEENRRQLTAEDREFLTKYAGEVVRARVSNVVTDPATYQELQRLVDTDPADAGVDKALLEARTSGRLSAADFETLVTRQNNNRKQLLDKSEATLHKVFTEGQQVLSAALSTTGPLDFDPVARDVKTRVHARLMRAMWGPEEVPGDRQAFRSDPVGFVNQLVAVGRRQLDSAIAERAFHLLRTSPIPLIDPTGHLDLRAIQDAVRYGDISKLDAERIINTFRAIENGTLELPDGLKPKPPQPQPKPAPPKERGILDRALDFFFGSGSEPQGGPEQQKPVRKPEKKRAF